MNLNFTELFFDVELKDTRTLKFSNNEQSEKQVCNYSGLV